MLVLGPFYMLMNSDLVIKKFLLICKSLFTVVKDWDGNVELTHNKSMLSSNNMDLDMDIRSSVVKILGLKTRDVPMCRLIIVITTGRLFKNSR